MASLFRLRQLEPALERPYKVPFYPLFPAVALGLALVALAAMVYYNTVVFGLFVGLFAIGFLFYRFTASLREGAETDDLLEVAQIEARSLAD